MKKITLFSTTFAVFYLLSVSVTNATVGGSIIISSIQTASPYSEEIIYELNNYGGKGCPPEVFSLSLRTNVRQVILGCDDISLNSSQNAYDAKLESVLSQYPTLVKRIDLAKNKITAQITVIGEEKFNPATGSFGRTDFRLDIFQDGDKKGSFNYSGCSVDQPHVIEGYAVPNLGYLVLLVSSKGDCFEGGYAYERLFSVPNITFFNSNSLSLKGNKEAAPGPGNIYAIASKTTASTSSVNTTKNTSAPLPQSDEPQPNITETRESSFILSYMFIIGALVVIILVLVFKRR